MYCRDPTKTNTMINACDKKGKTALWYAIKYRISDAAMILIEKGATFDKRASDKVKINIILDKGISNIFHQDNQDGNTAFHEACLAGLDK